MAKEKKRGFFSWLGFGQKEQQEESKAEAQDVVSPAEPETETGEVAQQTVAAPVEHTEPASTEQVAESSPLQPETTQVLPEEDDADSRIAVSPEADREDLYQAHQERIVNEEVAAIESIISQADAKKDQETPPAVEATAADVLAAAAQEQIVKEEVAAIESLLPHAPVEAEKSTTEPTAEAEAKQVDAPSVPEGVAESAKTAPTVNAEPAITPLPVEVEADKSTTEPTAEAEVEQVDVPSVSESVAESAKTAPTVAAEPAITPFVAENQPEEPKTEQSVDADHEPALVPVADDVPLDTPEHGVPEEQVTPPIVEQEKPTKEGFFARLKRSLVKTKQNLGSGFMGLFRGKKIDDDLFEELEEQLLIADVGVETTQKIISKLTETASRKQMHDAEALYALLKEEMGDILARVDSPLNVEGKTPFVILMVGVNGVGKTTTIGKLARQFELEGKSVMLAAGDTFRAAAVEQLQVWGARNNIPVIAQHTGADSASVIFDAIQAAKARNVDVLIADTAGRLQNKGHLMEELKKIVRVMKKLDEDAPHEIMLTLDASTGQNAISQAKLFNEAVGLTGITLTKLDGTAKGGVIFSIADQFGIPIRYIGVGEQIADLRPFNSEDFIEALFARED